MYKVQRHIHLGLTLSDVGEKAPIHKWSITDRPLVPRVFATVNYSLTGTLRPHVLRVNGSVARPMDVNLVVVVNDRDNMTVEQRKNLLISFHGEYVYYVDTFHPDDGEDHSAAVWRMYCAKIGEFKVFSPALDRYFVEVSLLDAHTI